MVAEAFFRCNGAALHHLDDVAPNGFAFVIQLLSFLKSRHDYRQYEPDHEGEKTDVDGEHGDVAIPSLLSQPNDNRLKQVGDDSRYGERHKHRL